MHFEHTYVKMCSAVVRGMVFHSVAATRRRHAVTAATADELQLPASFRATSRSARRASMSQELASLQPKAVIVADVEAGPDPTNSTRAAVTPVVDLLVAAVCVK